MAVKQRVTWANRLFVLLLAAIFAGVAWHIYVRETRLAEVREDLADWKVVPGKIEQSKIVEIEDPISKPYLQGSAIYTYTYEGQSYRASRVYYDFDLAYRGPVLYNFHTALREAPANGKPMNVWVNRRKPAEAALYVNVPESSAMGWLFFLASGLAALVLAGLIVCERFFPGDPEPGPASD